MLHNLCNIYTKIQTNEFLTDDDATFLTLYFPGALNWSGRSFQTHGKYAWLKVRILKLSFKAVSQLRIS